MQSTPRGLATLALLSARFDEGRDHLGLFEPFVADAVLAYPGDHFVSSDIRPLVSERSGLLMPADTINTILGRFVKKSKIRRDGGRFIKTAGTPELLNGDTLEASKRENEAAYQTLATTFQEFASGQGLVLATPEDALAALCAFIADNKVPLLLNEQLQASPPDRSTLSGKLLRVTARFVAERCVRDAQLGPLLEALVEGIVLQDTLMLQDLADLGQRLNGLVVFLDTPVLFAALELAGVANGVAAKEGLSLLREAGATTCAFDVTIAEMRRILSMMEAKISTAAGRVSLYPTDLVRHILTSRLSAADIRTISATLEQRLSTIAVSVKAVPKHEARYTLDELALGEYLMDRQDNDSDTPRIRHDVDCVAGVLTRRAGVTSTSIERSKAVFCTSSGRVVRNVQQWYNEQNEGGVPPIVHQFALSSIAWLKRPRAAKHLKLHELISVCSAALKPSRATWDRFTEKLKQLRRDGAISDDETVAIIASELTEPLLVALDDDIGSDTATIDEAIERVRESYKTAAAKAAAVAIDAAESNAAHANQIALNAILVKDDLLESIERRSATIGRTIGSVFYASMILVLLVAGVLALPGGFEPAGAGAKLVSRVLLGLATAYGLYGQVRGTSVKDQRYALESAVARVAKKRLYGLSDPKIEPSDPALAVSNDNSDPSAKR